MDCKFQVSLSYIGRRVETCIIAILEHTLRWSYFQCFGTSPLALELSYPQTEVLCKLNDSPSLVLVSDNHMKMESTCLGWFRPEFVVVYLSMDIYVTSTFLINGNDAFVSTGYIYLPNSALGVRMTC